MIPEETWTEITALKGIAAYYVMQDDDRVALQARQRELLAELVTVLLDRAPDELDEAFLADWQRRAATTPRGCGSSSTRSRH